MKTKKKIIPLLGIFGMFTAVIINFLNLQWAIIFIALFASGILFIYSKSIAETIYFFDENLSCFTYCRFAYHHLSIKIIAFLIFLSAICRFLINIDFNKILVLRIILIFCISLHGILLILAAINKWQQFVKYDYWGIVQSLLRFLNKKLGENFLAAINLIEGVLTILIVIFIIPDIEYNELLKNIPWYLKFILFAEEGCR